MKIKKFLINCLVVVVLFITAFFAYYEISPKSIGADSGFDSSYDGGSSGGDYGGSDYGGDYGGSSDSSLGGLLFFIIIIAIQIVIFYNIVIRKPRQKISSGYDVSYNLIFDMLGGIDINNLKMERYNQYIAMQRAMCNLDINYLKNILTTNLCEKCESEFEYIKNNSSFRIFSNVELKAVYIVNIWKNANLIFMKMHITYKAIDYIMGNGKNLLVGSKKDLYYQKEVTFVLYPDNTWLISDVRTRKVAE